MPDLVTRFLCTVFLSLAASCALAGRNADFAAPLRADIDARAADDRFAGVVLVSRGGETIFAAAAGLADRERHLPITTDTRFRFGSLGKTFTAVAIAQLEQAGKLRFDDPLVKFLPDYPNRDVAKVTIHQLLTHTGGTGDIFGAEFPARRTALRELRDYVHAFGDRAPEFPAGSRHEYSNYGYILLGRVIEVVSGRPYDEYVRDHVFAPSGMSSTGNEPEDTHVASLAVPYSRGRDGGALRSAEDTLPYRGTSAGGGYTTGGDLLKFAAALRSNKLLPAAATERLLAGKVDTPFRGLRYAYGFEDVQLPDGRRRVGHGGGAPGMNAVLSIYPDSGDVVVVLANLDPPAASDVDRSIGRALSR